MWQPTCLPASSDAWNSESEWDWLCLWCVKHVQEWWASYLDRVVQPLRGSRYWARSRTVARVADACSRSRRLRWLVRLRGWCRRSSPARRCGCASACCQRLVRSQLPWCLTAAGRRRTVVCMRLHEHHATCDEAAHPTGLRGPDGTCGPSALTQLYPHTQPLHLQSTAASSCKSTRDCVRYMLFSATLSSPVLTASTPSAFPTCPSSAPSHFASSL